MSRRHSQHTVRGLQRSHTRTRSAGTEPLQRQLSPGADEDQGNSSRQTDQVSGPDSPSLRSRRGFPRVRCGRRDDRHDREHQNLPGESSSAVFTAAKVLKSTQADDRNNPKQEAGLSGRQAVVEIYDVGPNPHANEILVAYLPKEKILFQADLLNAAPNGAIPIAQDSTISFSERIQQLGLQVEKIYGVHGRVATPEELRTSIEKRRASDLK